MYFLFFILSKHDLGHVGEGVGSVGVEALARRKTAADAESVRDAAEIAVLRRGFVVDHDVGFDVSARDIRHDDGAVLDVIGEHIGLRRGFLGKVDLKFGRAFDGIEILRRRLAIEIEGIDALARGDRRRGELEGLAVCVESEGQILERLLRLVGQLDRKHVLYRLLGAVLGEISRGGVDLVERQTLAERERVADRLGYGDRIEDRGRRRILRGRGGVLVNAARQRRIDRLAVGAGARAEDDDHDQSDDSERHQKLDQTLGRPPRSLFTYFLVFLFHFTHTNCQTLPALKAGRV